MLFQLKRSTRSICTAAVCLNRIKTSKDRREYFEKVRSWKANPDQVQTTRVEPRLPKKKVALLIGFNGSRYQGMQANPGAQTIESVLFDALCKAGAVSSSNAMDPKKVQLMRAARTDKGVHASCNVVSLKMICEDKHIVEKLNKLLPDHIRVWGYVETQRSFHAKNKCDSRIYEYLFPSYALKCLEKNKKWTTVPKTDKDIQISTLDGTVQRYIKPTDPQLLFDYRVDIERYNRFKQAMSLFLGTHNFHNYTIARSFHDKASNRHMIDIKVEKPILIHGMEWISVKLHGQSFMLHQIRKMISMAMLSVRTETPSCIIPKTFESTRINIPKAPALGLLLDRPVFHYYNQHINNVDNDKQAIDPDNYKDDIQQFKKDFIYTKIFEKEHQQNMQV
ncbi:pseudouridine synthase [Gilbertella persicaria]|uniref:pseudouridine synthase n=1 Tax=Gilbertella persicaria TaxID=101096 RepID=UPI00221EA497|nr:pseudouridine synthase [Gilbertella persicaria]KAI8091188.1 pseudouridine synthase [Gilbertella persicaria]